MRVWASGVTLSVLATGLAMPASALAQDQPPATSSRVTPYEASFFAPFAPRSALDIVRRIPGFTLESGNSNVRGFAGAAGNVVINGARPSSKSESLDTLLSRIPASSVVRVEVGPGDLFGGDYAAKSQVVNLILSATGGTEANVQLSGRRLFTGYVNTDATGSMQIKRGAATINLSGGTGRNRQVEEGYDDVDVLTTAPFPPEFRRKVNSYFNRDPYLSGSWALERAPDRSVRVNARWSPSRFDLTQRNRVQPEGLAPRSDSLIQKYRTPVFEIGGDVTRPLAGGAIKLVGLATRRKRDNLDTYLLRNGLLEDGATVVGGSEQSQKASLAETIGKLSWSRQNLAGFSVELAAEGALNKLDNSTRLSLINASGARVPIALPIADAVVKEKRGELTLNLGRNLSPTLRLDGGLAYEFSRLTVSGDAEAERSLRFLKPNLSLDWRPAGGWHARLSVRRTVAQLNFYDFISFAELSNDRVNGGNANLLPQRTWEFRGTLEKAILGDGLIKLDAGADQVSELQDIILTDEGFSAPGNVGNGRRRFVSLQVDAPLGSLGLSGVRLKLFGELQRTRVRDLISGETRNWSDFYPDWRWSVELRRDAGAWSYGFTVNDRDRFSIFRANEIDTNWNNGPYATAFVEWRPASRTSLTFDVDNAFDTQARRRRTFFFPNRSEPVPFAQEMRVRNRHVSLGLTLKQSFGSGAGKQ